MSDLIDRQAALDALNKLDVSDGVGISSIACGLQEEAIRSIENLPSAQPERKEGRWIIQDHPATGWFRVLCSECGEDVTSNAPIIGFFPNAKCIWDFCPWCGAKMGGDAE